MSKDFYDYINKLPLYYKIWIQTVQANQMLPSFALVWTKWLTKQVLKDAEKVVLYIEALAIFLV